MSYDNNIGHRCGSGPVEGAWQFPALDSGGVVIDLGAWKGMHVEISWTPVPDDPTDEYDAGDGSLFHGFFRTEATAAGGFDATTEGLVPTAPARLASGSVRVTVPSSHPWLRIEASHGTGLCLVRQAEG